MKKLYGMQQIMFDGERLKVFQWKECENEDGGKKCFAAAELLWKIAAAILFVKRNEEVSGFKIGNAFWW